MNQSNKSTFTSIVDMLNNFFTGGNTATASVFAQQVEAKNAAFANMTPEQKRVAIAQDVIAGLRSRRLVAEAGTYISTDLNRGCVNESSISENGISVQDVLKDIPVCNVCAKGAMFVSMVERFNQVYYKPEDGENAEDVYESDVVFFYDGGNDMMYELEKYFSREQLDLIEAAFEAWDNIDLRLKAENWRSPQNIDAAYEAVGKITAIPSARNRMIAIMENIVLNNGTFLP